MCRNIPYPTAIIALALIAVVSACLSCGSGTGRLLGSIINNLDNPGIDNSVKNYFTIASFDTTVSKDYIIIRMKTDDSAEYVVFSEKDTVSNMSGSYVIYDSLFIGKRYYLTLNEYSREPKFSIFKKGVNILGDYFTGDNSVTNLFGQQQSIQTEPDIIASKVYYSRNLFDRYLVFKK